VKKRPRLPSSKEREKRDEEREKTGAPGSGRKKRSERKRDLPDRKEVSQQWTSHSIGKDVTWLRKRYEGGA